MNHGPILRPKSQLALGTFGASPRFAEFTNSLSFPLKLKATIVGTTDILFMDQGDKRDGVEITLDLVTRMISVGSVQVFIDELLQVSRIKSKNAKLLYSDTEEEKIGFLSRVEREKFIESFWLLKEGVLRVSFNPFIWSQFCSRSMSLERLRWRNS